MALRALVCTMKKMRQNDGLWETRKPVSRVAGVSDDKGGGWEEQ